MSSRYSVLRSIPVEIASVQWGDEVFARLPFRRRCSVGHHQSAAKRAGEVCGERKPAS
jgi:hypothetical protein